ncbi:MAG: Rne/Rng family ribonuclease, partial [Gemmatimonadaceae bacterium]|nr:Rne/Rng family ribonuclease [Acetobacteraceae bacterium]
MTKRMLIDSTHAEETRVVVLEGNRLEDFDVESSTKQQLKGNIYLAKVVRVEPSLQAAFVEYGGNRHGFLAFGEIHPDYYQIPVADRQRLLEMQEAEAREEEEAEDQAAARDARAASIPAPRPSYAGNGADIMDAMDAGPGAEPDLAAVDEPAPELPLFDPAEPDLLASDASQAEAISFDADSLDASPAEPSPNPDEDAPPRPDQVAQAAAIAQDIVVAPYEAEALFTEAPDVIVDQMPAEAGIDMVPEAAVLADDLLVPAAAAAPVAELDDFGPDTAFQADEAPPESIGGEVEESREQRATPRFMRNYKIQEVIRRRQILLIQVVKEERGTKGAALTTYISLAGRFSVLMPNSPRGGGISRKITSAADRRRLKEVTTELDLPRGMGLIVRTAGANRPKPEIIRDCEYLLNQWDQIRDLTMKSMAPALIYEEASLIKRAIRDVYSRDVDDILVDGEQGWRAARDFMRMLMPTHAKKVQLWKDPQPLFVKAQVEAQLDAMLMPTVQLKSGGYLVINQTEALVAIDVNSGRSTRERGIEETALKTNLEAADEAARQLRLRDLAGLIVIDFIDMESRRNNASVEKRLKDALKNDRARIQVGSISHFGLLEMSRQRLRPSLAETSFVQCAHCAGTGQVRSTESAALHVLRGVEEEGAKRRAAEVIVHVAGSIALYVLNHKRVRLAEIEARYGMKVAFAADDLLLPPNMRIDRVRAQATSELPAPISQLAPPEPFEDPDEEAMEQAADPAMDAALDDVDDADDGDAPRPGETAAETEQRSKRKRRRRR